MFKDIYNFLPLSATLFRSGMPTADQLADASRSGVQMVINLAPFDPERDPVDEAEVVQSLGMAYLNIPVDWDHPTRENLREFMTVMDAHADEKMLVHCRANYRATGFISLYRVLRLGWKPEEALKDLRRIWNPDEYPVWKKFLEDRLGGGPA